MVNSYPGKCTGCGQRVAPGQGRAFKVGGRWSVCHTTDACNSPRGTFRPAEAERTHKERFGRCEDAPCCGCCGGGAEYMTGEDYHNTFGDG